MVAVGMITMLGTSNAHEEKKCNPINRLDASHSEFKQFISEIIQQETPFLEAYDASRMNVSRAIELLNDVETIDADFKINALGGTLKAKRKLETFAQVALKFENSPDVNVRNLAKVCLKIQKYGNGILENHYNFIYSPQEYLSDKESVAKLTEYTALFKDQYDYLKELLEAILTGESLRTPASTPTIPVELEYTQDELNSMEKWKDKSLDDMMHDALRGDSAALHMIGMCLLYGHGMPINVEQANSFFAASASLGFAPAIDKIRSMYVENDPNPFLSMIYANLTTSFGHLEYSMPYHQLRTQAVEQFGKVVVDEIERIATKKMSKIIECQRKVKEARDKIKATTSLMVIDGIVCEDIYYGPKYWESLIKSQQKIAEESE